MAASMLIISMFLMVVSIILMFCAVVILGAAIMAKEHMEKQDEQMIRRLMEE
jgi:hypothetical protein